MWSIYEIIHIWTAVVDESEEWSSQLIFQFKQLKNSGLQSELWIRTLGARSICLVHISREEWNDMKYIWNNSYFNCGSRWKWSDFFRIFSGFFFPITCVSLAHQWGKELLRNRKHIPSFYINNSVFLFRNHQLIVGPWKFDVLKTNMLVLRTLDFQGATIRLIVPRHEHSSVFIVHH